MDNNDKHEFKAVLGAVMDLYGKELSVPVLQLWFAALQGFSIAEVKIGFSRFVQSADSGSFAPKPADIIRMIEGGAGDRGMLAWGKVMDAIKRVGGWQSVCFDDPIIHCVLEDMGGWPKLCSTEGDEMSFRASDFAKRYRAYAERGTPDRFPPYLTGRHETSNRIGGYKNPAPMLIGEPKKCAEVMALGHEGPRTMITSGELMLGVLDKVLALDDPGKPQS